MAFPDGARNPVRFGLGADPDRLRIEVRVMVMVMVISVPVSVQRMIVMALIDHQMPVSPMVMMIGGDGRPSCGPQGATDNGP